MTKWELTYYVANITVGDMPSVLLLREKDKKTGKDHWDELNKLALEGWELVSVTPISYTQTNIITMGNYELLYTFKRPQE